MHVKKGAGCTCPKQKCCTCPKSKCCTCTTILYWCCTCPKCYCCTCTTLKQLLWLLPDSLLVPVALVQHNLKVLHMTYSKTAGVALARHLQKRTNCEVYSCPIAQMVKNSPSTPAAVNTKLVCYEKILQKC